MLSSNRMAAAFQNHDSRARELVIAVLADSHLGPSEEDVAPFLRALDQIRSRGATALFLLGDVFHYLVADRKFATPD
jgi:hypothetical protein